MSESIKAAGLNATRREFAGFGIAAVAATGVGAPALAAEIALPTPSFTPRTVNVPAAFGTTPGTLFVPEGQSLPGVVMYASPTAARSANLTVARQLAGRGWAVLLVDTPEFRDPRQIARDAVTHAAWLEDQPGVIKAQGGYTLRNFSAAFPKFSLASRAARQQAGLAGSLFAVPSKLQAKHDSLNEAARALHRLAA